MQIVFRADSSLIIGSGHIVRCLSLAQALAKHGADIIFICRELPGHSISLITDAGFNIIKLAYNKKSAEAVKNLSTYQQWLGTSQAQELSQMQAALNNLDTTVDWLIVDHYSLNTDWESQFKNSASYLMAIDDLANRAHHCNLFLDYNFYSDPQLRYNSLLPENCTKLFGPSYTLLREEFKQLKKIERLGSS